MAECVHSQRKCNVINMLAQKTERRGSGEETESNREKNSNDDGAETISTTGYGSKLQQS